MGNEQRINVATELSQMQRVGMLSVDTDAVERTVNGEFDAIIAEAGSVRDAADSICDLLRCGATR